MLNTLTRFSACLRAYGLRVSTGEVLDCSRALTLVNPGDPVAFRTVVRACLLKSRREQQRFEQVFDLFFHGQTFGGSEGGKKGGHDEFQALLRQEPQPDMETLMGQGPDADTRALAEFVQGNPAPFLARVQTLHTQEEKVDLPFKSNLSQLSARLALVMAVNQMEKRLWEWGKFQETGLPSDRLVLLERARALAVREPETDNPALIRESRRQGEGSDLAATPFANLTGPELERIQELMAQLVRKLKDKTGRRFSTCRTGGLDLKKTLRRAARYQGIPLEIIKKKQPPRKGKILALCDVSGSVWSTARFMLQILYTLQDCFAQVRTFVFVAELKEVTDPFKGAGARGSTAKGTEGEASAIEAAMAEVLDAPDLNLEARTDYGAVLQTLTADHWSALDRKTTLLILGDARSNYYNPQNHLLEQVRDRVRRIIWLTPEPAAQWNLGDCEIATYAPHCHEVRTLNTLDQLSAFVTELVL